MCIRDSPTTLVIGFDVTYFTFRPNGAFRMMAGKVRPCGTPCLLYTSDAADERSSVDLGGRRIIKKKNKRDIESTSDIDTRAQETCRMQIAR